MPRPLTYAFGGDDMPQTAEELRYLREQMNAIYRPRAPRTVGEGLDALGEGLVTGIQKWRAGSQLRAGKEFGQNEANWLTSVLGNVGGDAAPQPKTSGLFSPPSAPDGPIQLSGILPNPDDRSIPAAIRHNNPGAMWPGPSSEKFGATGYQMLNDGLGQGNRIATFPTPEQGGAALFDLLDRRYTGKTLSDAISKWSGGNSSDAYTTRVAQATGLAPDTVLTSDMVRDPTTALALANAMASHEAGRPFPMPEGGWSRAHQLFLANGANLNRQSVAPTQQPPQVASSDPAATAFLTGNQQAGAPGVIPQMPEIVVPKVASGVPQAIVPQPRLSMDDLSRATAIANNPFVSSAAREQAKMLVQEEMKRRSPDFASQMQEQAMEMELKRRQLSGEVSPMDAARLKLDMYRQQVEAAKIHPNYMAAADRARVGMDQQKLDLEKQKFGLDQQRFGLEAKRADPTFMTAADRARIENENKRLELEAKRADPAFMTAADRARIENENKRLELEAKRADPTFMTAADRARIELDQQRFGLDAKRADPAFMTAADRARIENENKRLELEAKRADPAFMTAADRARIELDQQRFDIERRKMEQEIAKNENVKAGSASQRLMSSNVVLEDIDRALRRNQDTSQPVTGALGAIAGVVPGTAAADIDRLLTGIRANIGFDKLNEMRQISPTGAALGNVTERELQFLQGVLGDLDRSQSNSQWVHNMKRLERIYFETIHGPGSYKEYRPPRDGGGLAEKPKPSAPQNGGMTTEQLDEIRRKYGGGQ